MRTVPVSFNYYNSAKSVRSRLPTRRIQASPTAMTVEWPILPRVVARRRAEILWAGPHSDFTQATELPAARLARKKLAHDEDVRQNGRQGQCSQGPS